MRVRLLQHPEPELAGMAKELHQRKLGDIASLARAAVERGEIAAESDLRLLVEMLSGALHTRMLMRGESTDDAVIARFVDVLLHGASARQRPQQVVAKGRSRRTRPRSDRRARRAFG
jgi:hypothetical protein